MCTLSLFVPGCTAPAQSPLPAAASLLPSLLPGAPRVLPLRNKTLVATATTTSCLKTGVLGNYGTCSFPILSSLWKSKEKEIKDGRPPSKQTVHVHADSQTHSFLGCFCFCSICELQMRKMLCCMSLLQETPRGKWQLTCRPSSTA